MRVSSRQAEVLALAAEGYTDREIAKRLGCAYRTVRTHLERVYATYGTHSRTAVVVAWVRDQDGRPSSGTTLAANWVDVGAPIH